VSKMYGPHGEALFKPQLVDEKIGVSVDADADIFDEDLEAPDDGFWIIKIATDTAGYPKVKETPAGSDTSRTAALNEKANLTTDSEYEFLWTAHKGDAINIQFSASAKVTVRVFFVRSL